MSKRKVTAGYQRVRIVRDYNVPGTNNRLHSRGDQEILIDALAEWLMEHGYALPVQERITEPEDLKPQSRANHTRDAT